ncbi:inosose dehydratase [Frondihabitans sp. PhB188]|uniref:sugar phosphate isomerase/epimerase family protein n=1 Tax=Frondihabitans sp. PhB188 TaxID=2485200 RepID=UPI000F49D74C|nr:sugar phosphate isomerase/epimerase [Frondihabitans sp. PhB188]ROQ30310.1 inosose dehydratase [Frondihabitans sp. PhB188]
MTTTAMIATAPISWGISEVAEWGFQFTPDRVLTEMKSLGFTATEMGPDGFLPEAPTDKAAKLREYGMTAVGTFVPVILHRADVDPLPRIERELADYAAAGAEVLIVAAITGIDGYDQTREPLTDAEWSILFGNLERIRDVASAQGITSALHPHVGTIVETAEDVQQVLDHSTFSFCFDTGHLMIGGVDPVAFAAEHADRIAVTHLKDVSTEGMLRVKRGEKSYFDSIVDDELYRPLGQGDVDIRSIVASLLGVGYTGWFVLEQDKVVLTEPAAGRGPIEDARASVTYLRGILDDLSADGEATV